MNEARLHAAAAKDDAATIGHLLAQGVQIDARDGNGRTALLVATRGNRIAAAKALVEGRANVNLADDEGITPLQHARSRGYTGIEQILVAAGAH